MQELQVKKKGRDRECDVCGKVTFTASKSTTCLKCAKKAKTQLLIEDDRKLLQSIYEDVELVKQNHHGKFVWSFVHTDCGTRQSWVIGNVKKQLRLRPDHVPCSRCGGKERMAKALEGYVEKFHIDNVEEFDDYTRHVRKLTEQTYKKNKFEINPLNLKRGIRTYHLDHKVPIIQGFLQGIPAEVIAAKENLQILPALSNLSKGRK